MSILTDYINESGYENYIIDPITNPMTGMRKGGRGNHSQIIQFKDRTEWVYLSETRTQKERFCGFLFLESALKTAELFDKIRPAENKMTIHGDKIIYLSRYCGEERIDYSLNANLEEQRNIGRLNEIGFIDTMSGANLRKENGVIWVFDTEKNSFDKSVYPEIDSFESLHDEIRLVLEFLLKE